MPLAFPAYGHGTLKWVRAGAVDRGDSSLHTGFMTVADRITTLRLILAPVFFVVYLSHRFFPALTDGRSVWIVAVLWVIFLVSEITDFLDGYTARKMGEVSDFGKLYDPFADTLTQISYFFCFVIDGILPSILFLLVLYREFGILFVRNLMLRKGTVLGAQFAGKVKTVTYILAIGCALFASSINRLIPGSPMFPLARGAACVIFVISVLVSIYSFLVYVSIYRKK